MKMREALWSAVACYRFRLGQLAGRGRVYRAFGERGRERARGIKAAASCRSMTPFQCFTSCGPEQDPFSVLQEADEKYLDYVIPSFI